MLPSGCLGGQSLYTALCSHPSGGFTIFLYMAPGLVLSSLMASFSVEGLSSVCWNLHPPCRKLEVPGNLHSPGERPLTHDRGTAPSPLIGTTLRSDLDLGRSCYDADSNSDSPVWSGGSAIPTSSRVVADVTGLGVPWVYTVLGISLWDYVASFSGTLLGCLPWLGHLPGLNSLLAISGNTF